MPTGVRLGVSIPQTILAGAFDARAVVRFLTRAEALGFESAWVVEQILGSIPSLEPVTLLTYAAACTERLRLGSAVLLTALRSPIHLAKTLTTLDRLSGGRTVGQITGALVRTTPNGEAVRDGRWRARISAARSSDPCVKALENGAPDEVQRAAGHARTATSSYGRDTLSAYSADRDRRVRDRDQRFR